MSVPASLLPLQEPPCTQLPAGGAGVSDTEGPEVPDARFAAALDPLAAVGPGPVQRR